MSLCESTGGLFIEFSKTDVDLIVDLLSQSIESAKVERLTRRQMVKNYILYTHTAQANLLLVSGAGEQSHPFLVDNFITSEESRVGVSISGSGLVGAQLYFGGWQAFDRFCCRGYTTSFTSFLPSQARW